MLGRFKPDPTSNFVNPPILPILVKMQNKGISEGTIKYTARRLKQISNNADLNNPQNVINFITKKDVKNSYKNQLFRAYSHFQQYYEIQHKLPYFKTKSHNIRIPTTEELNTLISSARYPLSLKLTLNKETGLRPIETMTLTANDIDTERKTVHPTTAKYGAPRTLKISTKLAHQLETYITTNNRKPNNLLFDSNTKNFRQSYMSSRNRTAKKLNNLRLTKIRLYDFRHYFATMLYHKTKDILYVQKQMGHRRLDNTLIYTQLIQFDEEEEYTCKATNNDNEAMQLIENGFQYITTTPNALMLFRKRK